MLLKRIVYVLLALGLTGIVVWLGFKAVDNSSYVLLFGLATAFLAPAAIGAFKSAATADNREVLKRLSRVPEVEELVVEAEDQEERIRLLKQQRSRLDEVVRLEVRRQTLATRKYALEQDGLRILNELRAVEGELENLQIDIEASTVKDEIEKLEEQLQAKQRGDVIFRLGSSYFKLSRDVLIGFPFTVSTLLSEALVEGVLKSSTAVAEALSEQLKILGQLLSRLFSAISRIFRR